MAQSRKIQSAISARRGPAIDGFRARHLPLTRESVVTENGRVTVVIDEGESPLNWLARRRGRDGKPLIAAHQLEAGERLRADFTFANLTPRVTSDWSNPLSKGKGGVGVTDAADTTIAARQRLHHALDDVGPEFSGLLMDVCCFLKRLEDVERERIWPARSAKLVLQLGLDRLARHYGYGARAQGRARVPVRNWRPET